MRHITAIIFTNNKRFFHQAQRTFVYLILGVIALSINGCSTTLSDYSGSDTPHFELKDFFNGELQAYGMVQDRSGKVIRRFHVDLIGKWQGDQGTLEEDFYYDDGETQRRVWSLSKLSDGSYTGKAQDVIGEALGRSKGFAFNWHYTLQIKVDNEIWDINLNDWIYQLDNTRLINRTKMTKWGIDVGEITLIIERTQ